MRDCDSRAIASKSDRGAVGNKTLGKADTLLRSSSTASGWPAVSVRIPHPPSSDLADRSYCIVVFRNVSKYLTVFLELQLGLLEGKT